MINNPKSLEIAVIVTEISDCVLNFTLIREITRQTSKFIWRGLLNVLPFVPSSLIQ